VLVFGLVLSLLQTPSCQEVLAWRIEVPPVQVPGKDGRMTDLPVPPIRLIVGPQMRYMAAICGSADVPEAGCLAIFDCLKAKGSMFEADITPEGYMGTAYTDAVFLKDGRTLLSSRVVALGERSLAELVLLDCRTQQRRKTVALKSPLHVLASSEDGRVIAGFGRGELALYDTETWNAVARFAGIPGRVLKLAFLRRRGILITLGWEVGHGSRLSFWNARTGKEVKPPIRLDDASSCSLVRTDKGQVLFCCFVGPKNTFFLWELYPDVKVRKLGIPARSYEATEPLFLLDETRYPVASTLSGDGRLLAVRYLNHDVRVFDLHSNKQVAYFRRDSISSNLMGIYSMAFSADSNALFFGLTEKNHRVTRSMIVCRPISSKAH